MRTLLHNITIIPMTGVTDIISGDLGIEDGKIAFIGEDPSFHPDTVKDLSGMVALPAFVNCHTHLSMTLMRNYKDFLPDLQQWLGDIFPIEAKMQWEDVYYGSLVGAAELIKGGCTTFADMYYNQSATVRAARQAGIRGIIGLTRIGDDEGSKAGYDAVIADITKEIGNSDMFRLDPAVHAIYTCSKATYQYATDLAKEMGSHLHTHLSETKKEVDDCIKEYRVRPAVLLEKWGVFDVPCYLAHGVHLDDEELQIIKEHDAAVIHNPSSNMKLHCGICDISHYWKHGVNLALGTDGASSNNNLNMLKEINQAQLLCRLVSSDPYTPYGILKLATADGAKALGLEDRIGTLEVGKDADIVIFDTSSVNMSPVNDIFSAIVYSADRTNIHSVWCRGKELCERGKLLTLDEDELIKEHKRVWKDLLER